jgi:hypothetical protein
MFSSRKYSALPTSAGQPRKRSGGGMAAWKKYGMIALALVTLAGLGWTFAPSNAMNKAWDDESELL